MIHRHLPPDSPAYRFYLPHVVMVTAEALAVARRLGLDENQLQFIEEAGMLHDIGVVAVLGDQPGLSWRLPYICHGHEGRKILEAEGLPRHALVAERHTGVGITAEQIRQRRLPLPERDLVPDSIEEKIISYADLFFSKSPAKLWRRETVDEIRDELAEFGADQVKVFEDWHKQFGEGE
ncbi:MAG: phosphohydrolase [Candidatus Pacebacteria bacterium CG10_big_fil_rev_8_21_14_0_10_56_10]|nr:MAG: phosphohydrolase [Candidatus Pacebacteria bacterium CG10_big_fil_rev_8_21_14_0_10_56_10]